MDANRKWHLAWAQIDSFSKNLPSSIQEKHVAEFHGLLDLLHDATGEDVSAFQIPDGELKPLITSFRPASYSGRPGSVTYSKEKYCDRDLMVRKLDALRSYFERIQPTPEDPQKPRYGY
jgi:hypothetical protein